MHDRYRSVLRDGLFDGQVVVVTGGGSGIGRCTAHELTSLGAHVVIMGRTEDKLEAVVDEITADGGSASHHVCDIRDVERVDEVIAAVVAEHGRLDGLVNNAGGQFPGTIESFSSKGFDAVVRNNLLGTFHVMRAAHREWMGEHGGAIVNITAEHRNGFPGMAHTGAARAGVSNLTMTAGVEWGPAGIRVNEVAPGTVASSGMDTYDTGFQQIIKGIAGSIPLGRLGVEAEISAVICFLLSPGAAFMTGACVRVDGGTRGVHAEWPAMGRHDNAPTLDAFHRAVLPNLFREDD